jgi:SOS-response transcriptional repressor LexA
MELAAILARIEARLIDLGISASAASTRSGLSPDAIRNLRRAVQTGRTGAGVSVRTISALAPTLKLTENYILTGSLENNQSAAIGSSVSMVPITGGAADGVFMETDDEIQGYVPFNAGIYEGMEIFALKVGGAQQDEFFAFGSTIICVNADQSGIKDGDNVVLRRWSSDDRLAETTVKTVMLTESGPQFWPRGSTHIEHIPFTPTGPRETKGARWAVLGVIIAVIREVTPRGGRIISLP